MVVAVVIAVGLGAYLTGRCSQPDPGLARETEIAEDSLKKLAEAREAVERDMARADSLAIERARELQAERERAEIRARAAEQRANALARRLRDALDEDARPLLDSLVVAHERETAELRGVIAGQDSLAASLRGQVMTRDAVIAALQDELTASERVSEAWKARYETETGWWRGFGKSSGTLLVGAAVGAVAATVLGG